MIIVVRKGKILATHTDDQEYVVDRYSQDCDIIKADGSFAPDMDDPRKDGIPFVDLRKIGSLDQRIADLEAANATILGGGQ